MARTLADIVGQNKKGLAKGPSGVLTEQEDLQGLTGQAGLPAAPTTALGGAMIGASPDQQKMMGGPAQMQNALRMSVEGAETLEGARRLRQGRAATAAEQEKIAKAEKLAGLSSAEKTAQALIEKETQKLAPPAAAVPTPTAEQMVVQAAPTALGLTTDVFQKVRPLIVSALTDVKNKKPISAEAMAAINNALGRPIDQLVDENTLNQFLVDSKELIKQQGADAVRNNLFVKDLVEEPGFGYTSDQLSELLGVDKETLEKTSIGDLDLLIKNAQAQTYSTVAGSREALRSGLVGEAEAAALRGSIREASETGIAATEEDFQRLDDAVERADVITFAGKQMTIGDALKDETISQFISDYISATPEQKLEMEAQEPSLTQFVKGNLAVFEAADAEFKRGSAELKATQESTLTYSKNFPEELLTALVPDWKKPSATTLQDQTKNIPFFQFYESFAKNPKAQKQVSDNLARIVAEYPDIVNELKGLSSEDLKKLNLDKSGTTKLDEYIAGKKRYDEIQGLDPDNIDAIVQQLAGGDTSVSAKDIQKSLNQNASLALLGVSPSNLSVFDSDKDGKLDSPATLLSTLKKNTSVSGLGKFLTTKKGWSLPDFDTGAAEAGGISVTLLDKLSKELSDGKLTPSEIERSNQFTLEELGDIITSGEFSKLSVQARTGLGRLANRMRGEKFMSDFSSEISSLGKPYKTLMKNPAFVEQLDNPELYRQRVSGASWSTLEENATMYTTMLQSINNLLEAQSESAFPTVDIGKLTRYRDSLQAMLYMTYDEANARRQTEEEAASAQRALDEQANLELEKERARDRAKARKGRRFEESLDRKLFGK